MSSHELKLDRKVDKRTDKRKTRWMNKLKSLKIKMF